MEENQKDSEREQPRFDFMKEQIKERPLNKKKLLRRTVMTASMAVVFGLVACLTVLVLEPVFNNWLYPEKTGENITFSPETEEMLPEDMALDDKELEQEQGSEEIQRPVSMQEKKIDELDIYEETYKRLQDLAKDVSRCMVTVTGVTSDMDWFDNPYVSSGQTAGIIIANNSKEYLVLADAAPLAGVETIHVTFCDNSQVEAQMKMSDSTTGLAVLAVDSKEIGQPILDKIETAVLGSSNDTALTGSPVIALGSPMGISGSLMYGIATSCEVVSNTVDSEYKLITTDICGSRNGTGVLINLKGEVIGVITHKFHDTGMENMVYALGITELRETIERLSNGKRQAYLGVYGTDVTEEANKSLQVPYGAYVTEIEIDSPAMQAGIQSGDVVVSLNGKSVESFRDYIEALSTSIAGSSVNITIMRKNQEEYKEMSFLVALGELE